MGSELLFSMPSLLSGIARTLDIGGTYTQYNLSETAQEADTLAMMHDLAETGRDYGGEIRYQSSEQEQEGEPRK